MPRAKESRMRKNALALPFALSFAVTACTMAPRYERPEAPIPDTWPSGAAYSTSQASERTAADIPWREFIRDDKLRQVIDQALKNNRDLRSDLADIQSARAQYRIQRAELMPRVNGDVSATRSKNISTFSGSDTPIESEIYTASVGLSAFEIDLFGRVRSLSRAALESYLATEAAGRATRISLIAETASAYLTLAADNTQLALSRRTLESA